MLAQTVKYVLSLTAGKKYYIYYYPTKRTLKETLMDFWSIPAGDYAKTPAQGARIAAGDPLGDTNCMKNVATCDLLTGKF